MTERTGERGPGLADLVANRRAALRLSWHALAKESGLSVQTVYKIGTGNHKAPKRETLQRLSTGLQLPLESVLDAVAADMGYRAYDMSDGKRRAIYLSTQELSDAELDAVQAIVDSIRARPTPALDT